MLFALPDFFVSHLETGFIRGGKFSKKLQFFSFHIFKKKAYDFLQVTQLFNLQKFFSFQKSCLLFALFTVEFFVDWNFFLQLVKISKFLAVQTSPELFYEALCSTTTKTKTFLLNRS